MSRAEKTRSLPNHRRKRQEDCLIREERAGKLPDLRRKGQEDCLITDRKDDTDAQDYERAG